MSLVEIAILVIILAAVLPIWPYSKGWGYLPSGIVGLLLVLLILMLLLVPKVAHALF
ncbi:Protein of uncharacterised function (DUF3309) [Legionella lansingensis]|uniref:Transmembrane protein n=1 Tax=Legionella lansingensis TaxID=45067 RepID=A0A0W0VIK3_9GAMM|nr:DUF3309 family protein [Legionella lansingensis]KTD19954.1 hypothetical protein Llan_2049 [Legionella lansingensis]SNV48565.1 Protein of uncharacterised function (DUF3309) [Legionella lansingensis]